MFPTVVCLIQYDCKSLGFKIVFRTKQWTKMSLSSGYLCSAFLNLYSSREFVDGTFYLQFHILRMDFVYLKRTRDGKIKARGRKRLHGRSWLEAFYLVPNPFCSCAWMLWRRAIFKASLARQPLGSWEAPNNGIISDKVLRVAWPFLPLHKHRLECVQLCMVPLQYFCLL